MRILLRAGSLSLGLCLLAPPASAFQVTLGAGPSSLTIVDDDFNDLDPDPGAIAFAQTIGGVFLADGRVTEVAGSITRMVTIGTRTPGSDGVFRNLDTVAHAFSLTVETDVFSAPGPPLGWSVVFEGRADDAAAPTQGSVELPMNDVALRVDPGDRLLTTVSAPVTPPVAPADQPVAIDAGARGVSPTADATVLRVIWSFTPGAKDEIRLFDSGSGDATIVAGVFNAQDKCLVRMSKDAFRVVRKAWIDDARCVRDALATNGGDVTACADDQASPRTAGAENHLLGDFETLCALAPAFGANLGTCCEGGGHDGDTCSGPVDCPGGSCTLGACISGAAEDAGSGVVHDLFGARVRVTDGADAGRCQLRVLKALGRVHEKRWSSLARCERLNVAAFDTEADLVATCLGPPQPAFTDIGGAEDDLADEIQRFCIGMGVTPLASVFPGACSGRADVDYASCLDRRAACRFCRGAVVADDVMMPLSCDLFDDGVSNGSCP